MWQLVWCLTGLMVTARCFLCRLVVWHIMQPGPGRGKLWTERPAVLGRDSKSRAFIKCTNLINIIQTWRHRYGYIYQTHMTFLLTWTLNYANSYVSNRFCAVPVSIRFLAVDFVIRLVSTWNMELSDSCSARPVFNMRRAEKSWSYKSLAHDPQHFPLATNGCLWYSGVTQHTFTWLKV
jgi:hypothetical protein